MLTPPRPAEKSYLPRPEFDADRLLAAVETVCGIPRADICGPGKGRKIVEARDALILTARRLGATTRQLSNLTGLAASTLSRRHDAAMAKARETDPSSSPAARVMKQYQNNRGIKSSTTEA